MDDAPADVPSQTLGRALKMGRHFKNLTQAQAAVALGVSPPTLSAWENDHKSPTLRQADRIGRLYELDLQSLAALDRREAS